MVMGMLMFTPYSFQPTAKQCGILPRDGVGCCQGRETPLTSPNSNKFSLGMRSMAVMSKVLSTTLRALNDAEVTASWCIRLALSLVRLLPFVEMSDGNLAPQVLPSRY